MNKTELDLAKQVHYSFLPDGYRDDLLDVSVRMLAHQYLGGDYCSVFPVPEERIVVCMCDAVGHGVAAALFAARINTFVLSHSLKSGCPCNLIESMNTFFCRYMPSAAMYSSFFSMVINKRTRTLHYAGAGHPPVAWYDSQRHQVEFLHSSTTLVGIQDPLPVACEVNSQQLHAGDRLLMYTDGLTESRNPEGMDFGTNDLTRVLSSDCQCDSAGMNDRLIHTLRTFTGGDLHDDVMSMVISVG